MSYVIYALEVLLLVYFGYVVIYNLTLAVGGLFYRSRLVSSPSDQLNRFVVLIPAYKEDGVILEVAHKALEQRYPTSHYEVVIIADSLKPETVATLKSLPIRVVEVTFDQSTKVKSLNLAMQSLPDSFDYAVILDADNVMQTDFLSKLNAVHQQGKAAIQGERLPKNKNNDLAMLDGLSEAINNHIFRQGSTALGLSSSISGSAFSMEYPLMKKLIANMTSIGGFDRELEILLLQQGIKVYYLKGAGVYDEKVQQAEVFQNQRRRWISSQYHYLGKYFFKGLGGLLRGRLAYFNATVLRNVQLPRLINIGLLVVTTGTMILGRSYLNFGFRVWILLLGLFGLSLLFSIPKEYYSLKLFSAIAKLPGLFWRMFLLMFRLKGANKRFIHTPHVSIDVPSKNKSKS